MTISKQQHMPTIYSNYLQCESEVKQWVTELNNQFDEVDKFELVVE